MRLISDNYTQLSSTSIEASSENTNFPSSNIKHEFRSKQWRSRGHYTINEGNNKIDFLDADGGSELNASITVGNYNADTLATAIKDALESVSSDTFTITFSEVTGLWTIESDGSYLKLLNSTGTNNAENTLKLVCGFPDEDREFSLSYTGSKIAIHTEEFITFDLKTTEEINSIAILWPKEDGIKLSSNAVIKIQASATNVWDSPAVNQVLTINNKYEIASHYFETNQSYRYWRVFVEDPENANLYVNLGVVILGNSIEISPPENGFTYQYSDNSKVQTTDFGNEYVDKYPITSSIEFDYKYFDEKDFEVFESMFLRNGSNKPVFVVLDESSQVLDKDQVFVYGKMSPKFQFRHVTYNLYNTKVQIKEIL